MGQGRTERETATPAKQQQYTHGGGYSSSVLVFAASVSVAWLSLLCRCLRRIPHRYICPLCVCVCVCPCGNVPLYKRKTTDPIRNERNGIPKARLAHRYTPVHWYWCRLLVSICGAQGCHMAAIDEPDEGTTDLAG